MQQLIPPHLEAKPLRTLTWGIPAVITNWAGLPILSKSRAALKQSRDYAPAWNMELAIAGNPNWTVTHNVSDFHRAELRFPAIRIARPEEFVKETQSCVS